MSADGVLCVIKMKPESPVYESSEKSVTDDEKISVSDQPFILDYEKSDEDSARTSDIDFIDDRPIFEEDEENEKASTATSSLTSMGSSAIKQPQKVCINCFSFSQSVCVL